VLHLQFARALWGTPSPGCEHPPRRTGEAEIIGIRMPLDCCVIILRCKPNVPAIGRFCTPSGTAFEPSIPGINAINIRRPSCSPIEQPANGTVWG